MFGMSSSLCILSAFSPLSSGDNTSFFQPGLTVSDGLRVRSATRTVTFCRFSQWDVWTFMFGNDTKMKKDVYLVNIKHSWIYTGPLHFSLSSSSSPPLLLRCDMLQLSPSLRISNMSICLSVNCTPLSCGFFLFFHSRVLQIKSSPLFHQQTDGCYASTNTDFKWLNWLIKVYFCCVLSWKKTGCHNFVHHFIMSFT